MMPNDSVADLLGRLKLGNDKLATEEVWQRYFEQLAKLARQRLPNRRVVDEEDVALSAMDSFFRGVADGRFARLDDRDDLWQVLAVLVRRKAIDHHRRQHADKRGGGIVRGDSAVSDPVGEQNRGFDSLEAAEPSPEAVAIFAEACQRLFEQLGDEELTTIARYKLDGFSNQEIAAKVGRVERSIERKLQLIRQRWQRLAEGD